MTRTPFFIRYPSLFAYLVLSGCFAKEASVEEPSIPVPTNADNIVQEPSEPESVTDLEAPVAFREEGRDSRITPRIVDSLQSGASEVAVESLTIGGGGLTTLPRRAGHGGRGAGEGRVGVKAAGRAPLRSVVRHAVPPVGRHHSSSEEYTDHGVNPFILVADDAMSTFSIDVDTASYTLARRKLKEGVLPAWEGIRAEEFVNFFE